jgi:hypothetical protein
VTGFYTQIPSDDKETKGKTFIANFKIELQYLLYSNREKKQGSGEWS